MDSHSGLAVRRELPLPYLHSLKRAPRACLGTYRFLGVGAGGPSGADPAAEQLSHKAAEIAARVVDLVGLRVATGAKGLEECGRALRIRSLQVLDPLRALLEAGHEGR